MKSAHRSDRPNVFQYLDYRIYIQDFIQYLKIKKAYTARSFAADIGIGAPSVLNMIVAKKRKISRTQFEKLCRGFDLNTTEENYLDCLVKFTDSKILRDKTKYYDEILRLKGRFQIRDIGDSLPSFFEHWATSALFELLKSPVRMSEIDSLARKLKIQPKIVEQGLRILSVVGLIEQRGDQWITSQIAFQTSPQPKAKELFELHRQILLKSLQTLGQQKPEERALGALYISLSPKSFEKVKSKIFEFLQEINSDFSSDSKPQNLYQFHIQALPIARIDS